MSISKRLKAVGYSGPHPLASWADDPRYRKDRLREIQADRRRQAEVEATEPMNRERLLREFGEPSPAAVTPDGDFYRCGQAFYRIGQGPFPDFVHPGVRSPSRAQASAESVVTEAELDRLASRHWDVHRYDPTAPRNLGPKIGTQIARNLNSARLRACEGWPGEVTIGDSHPHGPGCGCPQPDADGNIVIDPMAAARPKPPPSRADPLDQVESRQRPEPVTAAAPTDVIRGIVTRPGGKRRSACGQMVFFDTHGFGIKAER